MHLTLEEAKALGTILSQSNVAKLSDFADPTAAEPLLQSLVSKRIIRRTTLPAIKCPVCGSRMEERLETALVCQKCRHSIELDEHARNLHSSFGVAESNAAEGLRTILVQNGLAISDEGINIPFSSMHYIGSVALNKKGSSCDFLFSSKPLTLAAAYALLGFSARERRFLVLAYSSLGAETDWKAIAVMSAPTVRLVHFPVLATPEFPREIQSYLRFSHFLIAQSQSLEDVFNRELELAPTAEERRFLEKALILGKVGRERFESVALRLLQVLGPTGRLKGRGNRPEGALFLPTGFCIVDAKSTTSHFDFSISERDKIRRYLGTVERKSYKFSDYRFYSEIILTRSLPEPPSSVLDKVEDYFRRNPIQEPVVVASLEGLLDLHRKAWSTPEFYYRIDFKQHPLRLFRLQNQKLPSDSRKMDRVYEYVSYVDESRFSEFFEHVMVSPIIGLSARTKDNLVQLVSQAYEKDF